MKILSLLNGIPYVILQRDSEEPEQIEVLDLVDQAQDARPGSVFICVSEDKQKAGHYLEMAYEKGVRIALTAVCPLYMPSGMLVLQIKRLARYAGRIAAEFTHWPSQHMRVIGITGTNGKTSTAVMLHHICEKAGMRTGLLGTIENTVNGNQESTTNTTLPAVPLQKLLDKMRAGDTQMVVMEVSSHALDQYRVQGIIYETAVFTNLTQDHLDYHGTMSRYAAAKAIMFRYCRKALLNGDDARWMYYAEKASGRVYTYGFGKHVDFRASAVLQERDEIRFQWSFRGESLGELRYPSPGIFQIYNILAAASAAWLEGISEKEIQRALDVENPLVQGRFQQLQCADGLRVIVDYAHTPDGLKQVLKTARLLTDGKLITVFGCGGNRDRAKRKIMGQIADQYSDWILLTSDNPRDEEPMQILCDIREGISETVCDMIEDRKEAIQKAVMSASGDDIIVVAGKGHEKEQWVRGCKRKHDDVQCVKKAFGMREVHPC